MITPTEFRTAWCDEGWEELKTFPKSSLVDIPIGEQSRTFLIESGLPDSAAPYLSFGPNRKGEVPRVDQLWQIDESFAPMWVVGSTGAGDPVCIDTSDSDSIVYLNHDNRYRRILINSSVVQLAESLLAYRVLVRETQARNGREAYLDGNIPDDLKSELAERLKNIDPSAYNAGSFWFTQCEFLKSEY